VRKSQLKKSPFYAVKDISELKQDNSLYDRAVTMMKNNTAVNNTSLENQDIIAITKTSQIICLMMVPALKIFVKAVKLVSERKMSNLSRLRKLAR
jgi:hypothetical protein